jgi:hypothetical protein
MKSLNKRQGKNSSPIKNERTIQIIKGNVKRRREKKGTRQDKRIQKPQADVLSLNE